MVYLTVNCEIIFLDSEKRKGIGSLAGDPIEMRSVTRRDSGMLEEKKELEIKAVEAEEEEQDLPEEQEKPGFNYILYLVAGGYALLQGVVVFKNIVIDGDEGSPLLIVLSLILIAGGVFALSLVVRQYMKAQAEAKDWDRLGEEEAARQRKELIARAGSIGQEETAEEEETAAEGADETSEKEE